MMSLALRNGCEAPDEVGVLFSEYTELLIAGDPAFQAYLELQNYAGELVHLEEKYSRPAGNAREGISAPPGGCIWRIGTVLWRGASPCADWMTPGAR